MIGDWRDRRQRHVVAGRAVLRRRQFYLVADMAAQPDGPGLVNLTGPDPVRNPDRGQLNCAAPMWIAARRRVSSWA